MTLISFILRSSWGAVAIALITGLLSGGFSAGLLVIITFTAASSSFADPRLALAFVGLGLLALTTSMILSHCAGAIFPDGDIYPAVAPQSPNFWPQTCGSLKLLVFPGYWLC